MRCGVALPTTCQLPEKETEMAEKQRIYMIGAGGIARAHAKSAAELGVKVELKVADIVAEARDAFKKEFPDAQMHENGEEMLKEEPLDSDIVIVATPVTDHHPSTLMALETGRHVLCEKPLGMNLGQAKEMLAKSEEKELSLGCCVSRILGTGQIEETRKLISEGRLGDVYYVDQIVRSLRGRAGIEYQPQSRWFLDRAKAGGGQLIDHGIYAVAVLNDIFKPEKVEVAHAWGENPQTWLELPKGTVFDVEQHCGAILRYHPAKGGPLTVSYERAACAHGRELYLMEFHGSKGSVEWDYRGNYWGGTIDLVIGTDKKGQPSYEKREVTAWSGAAVDRALPYFHAHLNGKEGHHAQVGGQAVFNYAIICAIYDYMDSGKPQAVLRSDFG